MPARPLWKGHLRMSLVTIPVRVYPASNPAATIHFNQLHRKCETRIQYKKWCPHCNREVTNDEIVKGYEFERGKYVALEEEDIKKVRPESTKVIHLQQFATAAAVDPMLLEQPYYLAPDGKVAAESFAVMREALRGQAAIGTVAFHGREHLVAIEPRDRAKSTNLNGRRTPNAASVARASDLSSLREPGSARERARARPRRGRGRGRGRLP